MLAFDVAQFDGILKKITELNNALLSDQAGSLFGLVFCPLVFTFFF